MVKQISDKKDVEPIDLLQAFEIIVEKAKGSSLGEEFYQKADPYLVFVSDKPQIRNYAPNMIQKRK